MTSEEKQLRDDKMYMKIAFITADRSYCVKRKVGAIIVKDKNIISMGFNGTISGFENVCELPEKVNGKLITKPDVLHAEANAITKLACSTLSSEGSTIYITCSPCIECSKLIAQSKIKRVVYYELHDVDGIKILKKAGIECCHIEDSITTISS